MTKNLTQIIVFLSARLKRKDELRKVVARQNELGHYLDEFLKLFLAFGRLVQEINFDLLLIYEVSFLVSLHFGGLLNLEE